MHCLALLFLVKGSILYSAVTTNCAIIYLYIRNAISLCFIFKDFRCIAENTAVFLSQFFDSVSTLLRLTVYSCENSAQILQS